MPLNACVRRRTATVIAVAAACALSAAESAHAARQACAAAAAVPGSAGDAELRRALRCVVNAERGRHGLRPLRASPRLGAAARSHAADMVARGYFAHERPGWTLPGRLRAAGWDGSASAEAIAWGCGGLGVPSAVLDSWLASPPHRAIVLGRYSRAGVGLAVGSPHPIDCHRAGTWVMDVGKG